MTIRKLLKVHEVCERLGICKTKAYRMIASNELPSIRLKGSVRVPEDKLNELLERLELAEEKPIEPKFVHSK